MVRVRPNSKIRNKGCAGRFKQQIRNVVDRCHAGVHTYRAGVVVVRGKRGEGLDLCKSIQVRCFNSAWCLLRSGRVLQLGQHGF